MGLLYGRKGTWGHAMRLEGMVCQDCPDGKDYKNAFTLRATHKDKDYILVTKNASEKKQWMEALQEQIARVRKNEAGVDPFPGTPEQFELVILKKLKMDKLLKKVEKERKKKGGSMVG